jgi:hypothetical protein
MKHFKPVKKQRKTRCRKQGLVLTLTILYGPVYASSVEPDSKKALSTARIQVRKNVLKIG